VHFGRSLRVLLAVALLATWANALVHPIAHVDEAGALIHLAGGHEDDSRNDNAPDPLCDAIAAVAACVTGSAGFVFAAPLGTEDFPAKQADEHRAAPLLAYRSQAPPEHS
jgi:hypothetical protein